MRKVGYFTDKKMGVLSVCLWDGLFKNDSVKREKILEMLKVFDLDNSLININFFVYGDDTFLKILENITGNKAEIISSRTEPRSKNEYSRMFIKSKGFLLNKIVETTLNYDESIGIECVDESGAISVEISINDNDGSFIKFNTDKYDVQSIKREFNTLG